MREDKWRWPASMEPATVQDWAEVQELERDILLLYHQLMPYEFIMGDLDYAEVFSLPYWSYLNPSGLSGLNDGRAEFVQEGCLVMLLAMAWGQLDGCDAYMMRHRERIGKALHTCQPLREKGYRLLNHVQAVFQEALGEPPMPGAATDLMAESGWVFWTYVAGYFVGQVERLTRFRPNKDEMP